MRHLFAKYIFATLAMLLCSKPIEAQKTTASKPTTSNATRYSSADTAAASQWARNVMKDMSLDEKIGQLMFIRVPTDMNKKQRKDYNHAISHYGVGGICLFKGTAASQVQTIKQSQQLASIPLMVTIDGEWGLGMRLTDCYSFPRQMLMGALTTENDTLITRFGEEVGRQCRKMGIHVNFAPVADINTNPKNPVIGTRSFGENKKRVAHKAICYAQGLQSQNIVAVGKHFPGHGDTDKDSHLDLPVISHSKDYIDSVDLYPFKRMIDKGIRGIMVAHLQVNAYDSRTNMPSSLSEKIVNPLLREQMGFQGLVFTDGIDMKAITNNFKNGDGAIRALRAGCDVILLPVDVGKTIAAVKKEAKQDAELVKRIELSCFRILREKYMCGLNKPDFTKLYAPDSKDGQKAQKIGQEIANRAITLVRNEKNALPLKRDQQIVSIAVGRCDTATTMLDSTLRERIAKAGTAVISLYGTQSTSNNYGVDQQSIQIVNEIASMPGVNSILVMYASPYLLSSFPQPLGTKGKASANSLNAIENARTYNTPSTSSVIIAYQNIPETHKAVEQALYGEMQFCGKLPVTAGNYREGTSLKAVPAKKTYRYKAVQEAGMDTACFKKIDSIAYSGIKQHAYPGCQILVAKDGKIVFNNCYGRQTYQENSAAVDSNTVYDIASLTKICATTLAVMKLVDANKISLDDHLSRYLPYLKHTDKKKITVRQALSHIARLKAFDSYWKTAVDSNYMYYGSTPPKGYTAIGSNCYINPSFRARMLDMIAHSDLQKKERYLYSDLGFILLADLVQTVTGQSIDIFMAKHFYTPLHMKSTIYQPIEHGIKAYRIAPTENDTTLRKQTIKGYVHDPNAAAMGGVAGHAGLFSNANDLFRLSQMMLNEGELDGQHYISAKTFRTFNTRHYAKQQNRRALGFDKPLIKDPSPHVSPKASQQSFGHTGFTGTMIWIDPACGLVYIFLSNRVHPYSTPNRLASMSIRTDIQDLIYQSIKQQ